jgi:zinc/manganese transport system ATP-binding protein
VLTVQSPDPISTEGLGVRHGAVQALHQVTITFGPGTGTALMGANGSGKTTLLDCLAGLRVPTTGTVNTERHHIAYVRQHLPHGWMPLTVHEVVTMGRFGHRGLLGRLRAGDRDAIDRAARRLDVAELFTRQFGELSGGQRQRVMVAQALAAEPTVLLLDEPLTGLDIPSQERILSVLEEETSGGTIVVLSTHHLDEARHCDRVALLAGRIVALGAPEEVLVPDRLRETFGPRTLGDHDAHDHEHALLVLDDHGHDHG